MGHDQLEDGGGFRDSRWHQSIAVGSERFVRQTKQELAIRAKGRNVVEAG